MSPPEPVASLATVSATGPAKRRHASVWAVGFAASKSMSSRMPRVQKCLKATTTSPFSMGEEGIVSGGVFDHGAHEEDGPGTWEALAFPRHIPVGRRAGDPSPTHDTLTGARVVGPSGTEQAPASR